MHMLPTKLKDFLASLLIKLLIYVSPEKLVFIAYQSILGRDPDAVGLSAYASSLKKPHHLSSMITELCYSNEHWDKSFNAHSEELVYAMFLGLLGREPKPEALANYSTQLTRTSDIATLLAKIVSTDELWQKTLAARSPELVRAVYQGLLGREPEAEALKSYATKFSETYAITALLAEIAESDEHWEKLFAFRGKELTHAIFRGLLKRDADPSGLMSYSSALKNTGDLTKSLLNITASQEFRDKQEQTSLKFQSMSNFSEDDLIKEKLIFLHLPKTGGTTLHNLLIPNFGINEICQERFNGLRHSAVGELARYRYFSGHFDLPSVKLIPGKKKIIMMLREPVARLISLYYFQRAHKTEVIELKKLELARLANQYSIADFFRTKEVRNHPAINNAMTRVLSECIEGDRWEASTSLSTNIPKLDIAFEELKSLSAFGIMERYDDSVNLIFQSIGLASPEKIEKKQVLDMIVEENPDLRKIDKEPITEEITNIIKELVTLDIELYHKAERIFNTRLLELK
jgi:hypothetical protein